MESDYQSGAGDIRDARWDETGATCLGRPRLTTIDAATIKDACDHAGHHLPDCAAGETDGFLISMNPPADAGVADASP